MKTKLFKRIGALVLACMMCFALCSTAFAASSRNETIESGLIMSYVINPGADGNMRFWLVSNASSDRSNLYVKVECKGTTYIEKTIGTRDEIDKEIKGLSKNDVVIVTVENKSGISVPLYFGLTKIN